MLMAKFAQRQYSTSLLKTNPQFITSALYVPGNQVILIKTFS